MLRVIETRILTGEMSHQGEGGQSVFVGLYAMAASPQPHCPHDQKRNGDQIVDPISVIMTGFRPTSDFMTFKRSARPFTFPYS